MQYRLRTLLFVTAWICLIAAGLRSPTPLLSGIIWTVTLITVLFAILMTILCIGASRAMAIGYLIFCAGYLLYLLLIAQWLSHSVARALGNAATALYPLFNSLFNAIHRPERQSIAVTEAQANFSAIGHSAVACILGLAGALSAQLLYQRQGKGNDILPS